MGEKGPNPNKGNKKNQQGPAPLNMSVEEINRLVRGQQPANETQVPRRATTPVQPPRQTYGASAPEPPYTRPTNNNRNRTPEAVASEPEKKRVVHEIKFSKKAVITTLSLAGVVVVAAGYLGNVGGVQDTVGGAISSFTGNSKAESAIALTPNEKLGQESFAPGYCNDPKSAVMVVEVSGYFPLVPMVNDKNHTDPKQPIAMPKYLSKDWENKHVPADQQSLYDQYLTNNNGDKKESGYPQVEVKNFPIAFHVCEPGQNTAIVEDPNMLTFHRPGLTITAKDMWDEYDSPSDPSNIVPNIPVLGASLQNNGAKDGELDPAQLKFGTIPDPARALYLTETKDDPTLNKSVEAIKASMATPAQQQKLVQVLFSTIEASIVDQVGDPINPPKNIDGLTTFKKDLDNAIANRVVGKSADDLYKNHAFSSDGNYPDLSKPANDPATKQAYTWPGLDLTQKFVITSGKLEQGSIKQPSFAAPTPTPTPTPTKAASAEGK